MDCSPPGSSIHGIFQTKNTGVGCHFLVQGIFSTQGSHPHFLRLLRWQVDYTWERSRKPSNSLKWLKLSPYVLPSAKDKRDSGLGLQKQRPFTLRWKSKCLINKWLMGHAETMGHKILINRLCWVPPCLHTWFKLLFSVMMASFLESSSIYIFQAVRGKIKVSSWVFLALIVFSLK